MPPPAIHIFDWAYRFGRLRPVLLTALTAPRPDLPPCSAVASGCQECLTGVSRDFLCSGASVVWRFNSSLDEGVRSSMSIAVSFPFELALLCGSIAPCSCLTLDKLFRSLMPRRSDAQGPTFRVTRSRPPTERCGKQRRGFLLVRERSRTPGWRGEELSHYSFEDSARPVRFPRPDQAASTRRRHYGYITRLTASADDNNRTQCAHAHGLVIPAAREYSK